MSLDGLAGYVHTGYFGYRIVTRGSAAPMHDTTPR